MARYSSKRSTGLTPGSIRLRGRKFDDCAPDIEEAFARIIARLEGGIPAGFNDLVPTVLELNAEGSAGTETQGWAAADHTHEIDLGLSAKGDILTHDGTDYTSLASGAAADGDVLTKDAAQPAGLKWAPGSSSMDETRAMLPHPTQPVQLRAGSNITLTSDGVSTTIAASGGGGTAVDDMQNILANQIFGG